MNNKTPLSTQSLIEVKNLSFNRGERVIYDNISLNIRRGQITAIMGPSGTGKTTLLRLIGGQLVPDQAKFCSTVKILQKCLVRNFFSPCTYGNVISERCFIYGYVGL